MSFFSEEMAPMLETYLIEANELMAVFDRLLAVAEESNSFSLDDINEIFRTAHTIKSSSAMMGLEELSRLTHRMEDLFNLYRNDPIRIQGRVADVLEPLYQYSDYVKLELERMHEEDFEPKQATEIVAALDREIAQIQQQPAESQAVPDLSESVSVPPQSAVTDDGKPILSVHVTFTADCQMVNVRSVVILKQLGRFCHVIGTDPADLQSPTAADQISKHGLVIRFCAPTIQPVIKALKRNSYVQDVADITPQEQSAVSEAGESSGVPKKDLEKITASEAFLKRRNDKYISMRWDDVLRLQNITGELITNHYMLKNILQNGADPIRLDAFAETYSRLTRELDRTVLSLSMLSVDSLIPQLSRVVRDMSKIEGKDIEFTVEGGEMEIDRHLFESIAKPLLHIIRNAVDHGIEKPEQRRKAGKPEQGLIKLIVENQGGSVLFSVQDDGAGMDSQAILRKAKEKGLLEKPMETYTPEAAYQFILLPGFSTNRQVTEFSGRGVGMDVVHSIASEFGGSVMIDSKPGQGTTMMMQMPVSVTSVDCMRIRLGSITCFLPLRSIDQVYVLDEVLPNLCCQKYREYLRYGEALIPVLHLPKVYGMTDVSEQFALVIHSLRRSFCLITGAIEDQQLIVEKKLPMVLDDTYEAATGITGCTILGDGSIGFILDAKRLYELTQKEAAYE